MESASPLREAFTELLTDETARHAFAADPGGFLAAYGHADLPDSLVAEAISSFADTTSPEVAEHLAPFVMSHWDSPAGVDAQAGLGLLATAPDVVELDVPAGLDDDIEAPVARLSEDSAPEIGFGTGAEAELPETAAADDLPATPEEEPFVLDMPIQVELPPVDPGIENVNVGEGAVQTDEDAADDDIE